MEASQKVELFRYKADVEQIVGKVVDRPVLVQGGRGLGKSRVLDYLQMRFGEGMAFRLDGRQGPLACQKLLEWADSGKKVTLIDDLDILLASAASDPRISFIEVLKGVTNCVPDSVQLQSGFRLVATSGISFVRGLDRIFPGDMLSDETIAALVSSNLRQQLETYPLDPWEGRWADRWRGDFAAEVQAKVEVMDEALLNQLSEAILDLSGGHPAIFGPAIESLESLRVRNAAERNLVLGLPADADPTADEIGSAIREFLEDKLERRALDPLKSAIRKLQTSTIDVEKEAFRVLVTLAKNEQGDTERARLPVWEILRDEGLVYRDSVLKRYKVPGVLLRRHIREAVMPGVPEAGSSIEVLPESAGSGIVRLPPGCQKDRVSLSGKPWLVFYTLYQHKGAVVSNSEIQAAAKLPSNGYSVKNAIQRIQLRLEEAGASGIIVNEYGKGYRLVDPLANGLKPD